MGMSPSSRLRWLLALGAGAAGPGGRRAGGRYLRHPPGDGGPAGGDRSGGDGGDRAGQPGAGAPPDRPGTAGAAGHARGRLAAGRAAPAAAGHPGDRRAAGPRGAGRGRRRRRGRARLPGALPGGHHDPDRPGGDVRRADADAGQRGAAAGPEGRRSADAAGGPAGRAADHLRRQPGGHPGHAGAGAGPGRSGAARGAGAGAAGGSHHPRTGASAVARRRGSGRTHGARGAGAGQRAGLEPESGLLPRPVRSTGAVAGGQRPADGRQRPRRE